MIWGTTQPITLNHEGLKKCSCIINHNNVLVSSTFEMFEAKQALVFVVMRAACSHIT